ncbi:MAG: cyclase family protein [Actinomycetota bacterium]|nr:cyclase family protein [Actinomycetota bacterium]
MTGNRKAAMRIIDVSLGIGPNLPTWPDDPPVSVTRTARIHRGDPANVSELRLGSHTGTHVDPPFHFIDGAPGADALSLDVLIGAAHVIDMTGFTGQIEPDQLERIMPEDAERILFKTDNSLLWREPKPVFPREYVGLSPQGAAWLVERNIKLVGTDFLSIEAFHAPGHPTHRTLLEAGVIIVEGLDLWNVSAGMYTLACLPLKIMGGDGAPARAVLIEG